MPLLQVVTDPHADVLTSKAEAVKTFDDDLIEFVEDMIETMQSQKGIGLAAPQVGVGKRVIICQLGDDVVPMINPVITKFSARSKVAEEGCLSLPNVWVDVNRSEEITVSFYDADGDEYEAELEGLDARVVQHEVDHLNGVLITDRAV